MGISVRDIVAFSDARTNLSRLVDEVQKGAEKIITKNGVPAVALIDARRLDYYHSLERDRVHMLLMDEVERGLADVVAGRTGDALEHLAAIKARRAGQQPAIKTAS